MNPKDIVYKMLVLGHRPNILYSISFLVHVYSLWLVRARARDTQTQHYMCVQDIKVKMLGLSVQLES